LKIKPAVGETIFTAHHIPRDGGSVCARDYAGTGPAFVLMHGFPDNQEIYDDLVPHLVGAGRRVITFDFLGFGGSDHQPGATYSFAQQLGDLKAVVDRLQLGKVIPVGHDASGPAAINFALDFPAQVASICLLNSFYAVGPHVRLPELVGLFATDTLQALSAAILKNPEQFSWLLQFQQRIFYDALPEPQRAHFAATLPRIINANFSGEHSSSVAFAQMASQLVAEVTRNTARLPLLATLPTPITLIWGDHDCYLGSNVAGDLIPYLNGARLHVLPAGHWLQIDMPEQVAELMLGI
jgi:haloalkane dehalogenase